MRFLGINGILCFDNPVLQQVSTALSRLVPFTQVQITEETGMHFHQVSRFVRYRDWLSSEFDDGVPTLLVGHSLGGVIACSVSRTLKRTKVVGIVTINAPHRYIGYSRVLDAVGDLPAPIVTFQGKRDRVVFWGTKHPQSQLHTVLDVDHYRDIGNYPHHAKAIAEHTVATLFPRSVAA